MMRRTVAENLERRKEMMIAALWANSGFEGQEGANARRTAIEDLEAHYEEAMNAVLSRSSQTEEEEENLEENPFFAPAIKAAKRIEQPKETDSTVEDAISSEDYKELDQT